MNTISSLCLAIILVSLCVVHQTPAKTAGLIEQTCGSANVLYKDLCEKTLRADPASQGADIHGLAKIALSAVSSDVKAVQGKVAELLKSSSDEHTQDTLKDRSENYDSAADQINDSVTAMATKRYWDVNVYVSAAMTDGDTCEDGFKPGPSPLTEENENFGHLCSNLLAICNQAGTAGVAVY